MKLLILPLLLAGVGAGWLGLAPRDAAAAPQACDANDCNVKVECTPRGTCIITCTDSNGEIRCQKEIECDQVCDKECEKPCEGKMTCPKR